MFWVLDKPQCRPWDLQETGVYISHLLRKIRDISSNHFVHHTFMKLAWKPKLLVLSGVGSVLTVWFPYPSSPVRVIQLKLICGLWLLSHLIYSQCSCPGCCISPFVGTSSLGSIVQTSPSNLRTLCTPLPESKNSGPEKTNSLLGSCVLRDRLFIVHHRDDLCLEGAWRGGRLFAKLMWRRLVEV